MRDQLIILCSEEDYAVQLMEFMKEKKEFPFMVSAFSDTESAKNYIGKEDVEVLLYSGDYEEESLEQIPSKLQIMLRERGSGACVLEEGKYSVFKYQSAERILKEIINIFEQKNGIMLKEEGGHEETVIVVYSAADGGLSAHLAKTLLYDYSKTKRTLFLSFAPFIDGEILDVQTNEKGISDLIYYGKQWDTESLKKIKLLIHSTDSFDYIVGVNHWSDISEFTEEEAEHVINEIKSGLSYDAVIIDSGLLSNLSSALFRMASVIYEVISKKDTHREKSREFHRQLAFKEGDAICKKIIEVEQEAGWS